MKLYLFKMPVVPVPCRLVVVSSCILYKRRKVTIAYLELLVTFCFLSGLLLLIFLRAIADLHISGKKINFSEAANRTAVFPWETG